MNSMRQCMLLPVTDSVNGAVAFKVFEEIENYLKESSWCYYKSNSQIISILDNYEHNLEEHLRNPQVLKLISSKIGAGALIRIRLVSQVDGMDVGLEIIADNGEDFYLKEKIHLNEDNIGLIAQTIKNWLSLYEKTIPYDGLVIATLGNQLTIDIGKASRIRIGQEFKVKRPIRKRMHPLLKEIVEWETISLGMGKIFNVSEFQASGVIKVLHSEKKVNKGDWIQIQVMEYNTVKDQMSYSEQKANQFGKLGIAKISLDLGTASTSTLVDSKSKKIGGLGYGFDGNVETWITREYLIGFSMATQFSSMSKKEGDLTQNSNTMVSSRMKIFAGYKYLPMGFFFGPQVNLYLGYARYKYGLDTVTADGFGESTFKGILLGVNANAPIHKDFRLFGSFDLLPKPGYGESIEVHGESTSTTNYHLEVGFSYVYNPIVNLEASIQTISSRAKFQTTEVHHKTAGMKFGATFSF